MNWTLMQKQLYTNVDVVLNIINLIDNVQFRFDIQSTFVTIETPVLKGLEFLLGKYQSL